MTAETAARIAADVAARYGCPVDPRVVQVIPRGVSGLPLPFFNGTHLVNADPAAARATHKRVMWAGVKGRAAPSPEVAQRRQRIAALHAQGKTTAEIAAAISVDANIVRIDLQRLKLTAHKAPYSRQAEIDARRVRVAEMRAKGMTATAIAAVLGVSHYAIGDDLKALGLPRMRRTR